MVSQDRVLLRLHIEAVWGVQLPVLNSNTVEILSKRSQPPWKLCIAELGNDHFSIWRPDVAVSERDDVFARLSAAMLLPTTKAELPGISREVALHQIATPTMSLDGAQALARPLTEHDRALVESFEPGQVDYYFDSRRAPLIGVVLENRLLSLAHSSRRTTEACELGVDTLLEARRNGYALAATILWAVSVKQEQLVPLYSALRENTASLRLAHAAGYRVFARVGTIRF